MFDFVKNLFGGGYEKLIEKQVELDEYEAEIKELKEQEEPVNELEGISEPVISFVECVKNNPKRFGLKVEYKFIDNYINEIVYTVNDRVTKEKFKLVVTSKTYDCTRHCEHNFMNEKECSYVYRELYFHFDAKKERIVNRKKDKERQRLMSIYCKE